MHITNISEAKAHLSLLIKRIQETNQPVIIGKAGRPVAVLSPYAEDASPRVLGGSWEGKVKVAEDFDKTDEEISNNFYISTVFPAES